MLSNSTSDQPSLDFTEPAVRVIKYRKAVQMTCPQCGKLFMIQPSLIRCKNTFCGIECSKAYQTAGNEQRNCKTCQKEFTVTACKIRYGEDVYCSNACRIKGWWGPAKERLLAKRCIDPITGCWEFTGTLDSHGYGQIMFESRLVLIHRYSAYLFNQFDLSSPDHILHKCDNPKCFNPEHLFVGDNAMNSQDKVQKGRQAKGMGNHSKLSDDDVRTIRIRHANGETYSALGREYGVCSPTVRNIVLRKDWRHID